MAADPVTLDRFGEVEPPSEATAERYDLHFFVDGDETLAPFEAIAGRDFEAAEPLEIIASRYADRIVQDRSSGRFEQVECLVLCCCCGRELATATAYRD